MNPGLLHRFAPGAACLLATLSVSGCLDASVDPTAVLLTEETRSALATGVRLPSLPALAREAGADEALSGPLDSWSSSWERPAEEGREARREAYDGAADELAQRLGHAAVERSVARVGEALESATGLDAGALGPRIADNLALATERQAAAVIALEAGRDGEALANALRASDLLREVGPEGVVRTLIGQADQALSRAREGGTSLPEVDVERGERLVRGARLALEAGDLERAIRRAYYACQLLGFQPG